VNFFSKQLFRWTFRTFIALALPCVSTASHGAEAKTWPDKPVRVIVSYGPGSASDIIARIVASELQAKYKQSFIVENKPGANGLIGTEYVARADPDGYTLLLSSGTVQSINPHLFKKVPFDPIASFTAMGLVCTLPYLLAVDAKLPVKNMKEFMAYARQNKGLTYAYSNGPGQVGGYKLGKALGADFTAVPYKSSPQAMTDVIGGHIGFMFTDISSSKPFLKPDGLRALGLASDKRSKLLPDLPTIKESSGLADFEMVTWVGISGPAGVPEPIVAKVNAGINEMLQKPRIIETLAELGAEPAAGSPAQFLAFEKNQLALWEKKVKEANIEPQ